MTFEFALVQKWQVPESSLAITPIHIHARNPNLPLPGTLLPSRLVKGITLLHASLHEDSGRAEHSDVGDRAGVCFGDAEEGLAVVVARGDGGAEVVGGWCRVMGEVEGDIVAV